MVDGVCKTAENKALEDSFNTRTKLIHSAISKMASFPRPSLLHLNHKVWCADLLTYTAHACCKTGQNGWASEGTYKHSCVVHLRRVFGVCKLCLVTWLCLLTDGISNQMAKGLVDGLRIQLESSHLSVTEYQCICLSSPLCGDDMLCRHF